MDLGIKGKKYIVCGASSGFGLAVTSALVSEGAKVIAIARSENKLKELKDAYAESVDIFRLILLTANQSKNYLNTPRERKFLVFWSMQVDHQQ